MSLTACLALLLSQPVPGLPADAAVVYTGVPGCREARGAVRMQGLSVSATLGPDAGAFETLAWFKNDAPRDIPATILLPVVAQNPLVGRGYDIRFEATWDRNPVAVVPASAPKTFEDPELLVGVRNKLPYARSERIHGIKVTFKASSTHALRLRWEAPIGRGGLDGMLRFAVYDTSLAADWGPVGQFNFALRYTPEVVFQTYEAKPDWGWQIGPRGAFFKRTGFQPGSDALVRFVYYPGGFEKIGQ
ncbi:MAG: hypothetical protein N2109_10710 [Fimbriimonadales bacterium]|nr:hypothetical protein [Fimbriimonadales bacterium]